ncbi:unnamed protein product [Merluccius merluccius]
MQREYFPPAAASGAAEETRAEADARARCLHFMRSSRSTARGLGLHPEVYTQRSRSFQVYTQEVQVYTQKSRPRGLDVVSTSLEPSRVSGGPEVRRSLAACRGRSQAPSAGVRSVAAAGGSELLGEHHAEPSAILDPAGAHHVEEQAQGLPGEAGSQLQLGCGAVTGAGGTGPRRSEVST